MSKKKMKRKIQIDNPASQPVKTVSKLQKSTVNVSQAVNASNDAGELVFGRKNFLYLLGGIGLIAIGYILMAGGNMDSPDMWDEDVIYSTRRTLIAPIFILSGLAIQVYTIFSKK